MWILNFLRAHDLDPGPLEQYHRGVGEASPEARLWGRGSEGRNERDMKSKSVVLALWHDRSMCVRLESLQTKLECF